MDSRPNSAGSLFEQVYAQLLSIARQRLREERRNHTLQATALVNEAWIKLCGDQRTDLGSRTRFLAAAAEAMRRILIDHARKRGASKRGAGRVLSVEGVLDLASDEKITDALALDELILRLQQEDAQAAEVVRLRFYAGLSVDETAQVLGIGARSVDRDWAYARAWLQKEWLTSGDAGCPRDET